MKNDLKKILMAIKDGMQNDLNAKVDDFIYWCSNFYVNDNKTEEVNNIRNFIEKIAVYSELKYTDYKVNEIIPYSNNVVEKPSCIMTGTPITYCLDRKESRYLEKASYPKYIRLNSRGSKRVDAIPRLYLNSQGKIIRTENLNNLMPRYNNVNIDLTNKYLKDVVNPICDLFRLENSARLKTIIDNYENKKYFNEEIANCILYRIIERGGRYIGPRRALLVAKEFNMNIDIPMIYGYDRTDKYFPKFIAKYISFGGNKELSCYVDYMNKNQWLVRKISITDILKQNLNIECKGREEINSLIMRYAQLGDCIFEKRRTHFDCEKYPTCYDCIMLNKDLNNNLENKIIWRIANNIERFKTSKKKTKKK